ncbi:MULTISPECIES: FtsX-like permease family protein [Paenibacillus]|uniref:ABC3 transporter permease C-terminal domain-containing protein n=1 Tax=Paenibacillus borealis TaxID=160799 RepID=A0ABX3HJF7_PAEBO|nr:ABC transporter permease [Paenibacillus borealis]OMD50341.1 hypothetical protein BSK56_07345 [Paenibacillus borealis]
MYAKMILRNIKRSRKDYLIYMVTLIFCVGLFYAFMALSSRYYNPSLGEEFTFSSVRGDMTLPILAITAILLFLIKYVNDYMIKRKQKEFAIQTILGMEQKTTAKLFFVETLAMGGIAVSLGIIMGCFLSQLITAMLLSTYDQPFKFTFPLYTDTLLFTLLFFGLAFGLIGCLNIRSIRRIKIIDMLHADKKTETDYKSSAWMSVWVILAAATAALMLFRGIYIFRKFYSDSLPESLQISLYGSVISPAIMVLSVIYFGLGRCFSKRLGFNGLLGTLMTLGIFNVVFSFRVSRSSHVTVSSNVEIAAAFFFVALNVCGFFYFLNRWIAYLKEKSPGLTYNGENLFLFGQIMAKLKTTSKTMSIICLILALSLFLFALEPVMTGWMSGHLEKKSKYDVQVFSQYNNIRYEKNIAQADYGFVAEFLKHRNVQFAGILEFTSYFVNRENFNKRNKYQFPVLALSLSDYNFLRSLNNLEPIRLSEEEFTTQWNALADPKVINGFLNEHRQLRAETADLVISSAPFYQDDLGPYLYNTYTEALYVFPDKVCAELMPANQLLFINTADPLPYKDAEQLRTLFDQTVRTADATTGNSSEIRLSTLQINDSTAGGFTTKAMLNYTGVVLLIICFTVLSLQQLSDSSDFKYRFSILRNMGISERQLNRIILKQMGIWFGTPVLMAFIINILLIFFMIDSFYAELSAYIGIQSVLTSSFAALSAVIVLLGCYFISTWILFKRNIA